MISLLICSRNKDISEKLKQNIQTTIGIEYELVVIDNSKNTYSIFQAYNKGAKRAKYPCLCFMHEDILFHTVDWGKKVLNHFINPNIGIIGVAGGHYYPDSPAAWGSAHFNSVNILQNSSDNRVRTSKHIIQNQSELSISNEVVSVDGVWLCMPKSLFTTISFDESTFNGFHCYDVDICLQARNAGYQVHVIFDVLLEHFSTGNLSKEWITNSTLLYSKWRKQLPQVAGIELSQEFKTAINLLVSEKFQFLKELDSLKEELISIRRSNAYRFGKIILRPFKVIRKVLKSIKFI